MPRLHARPAAPVDRGGPRRPDRRALGTDGRRDPLGRLVHGHGGPGLGRDLLRPRGGRQPHLRGLRRPRNPRVLHPRALPQARRGADHRASAGRGSTTRARRTRRPRSSRMPRAACSSSPRSPRNPARRRTRPTKHTERRSSRPRGGRAAPARASEPWISWAPVEARRRASDGTPSTVEPGGEAGGDAGGRVLEHDHLGPGGGRRAAGRRPDRDRGRASAPRPRGR